MAKKPKYYLEYKLNADFNVKIDAAGSNTLKNDINRNEVCLTLNYTIDGVSNSVGAYSNEIEGGELNFNQISNDIIHVSVKGSYYKYLDPKWEQVNWPPFRQDS